MSTRNGAAIVLSGAVMETVAEVLRVGESPLFVRCDVKIKRSSIIGRSCPEYHFCRDKTRLLSRQKYACRDNRFVEKKYVCHDKYLPRQTKFLSREAYFCRDKHVFVATNICRDKSFVVKKKKKKLSRQTQFISRQNLCHDRHTFVDKRRVFVATKMIL